jgi:hypothetical protein
MSTKLTTQSPMAPVPLSVTEFNNYVNMKDIQNPVNILQQPKAKLTTNVFIPSANDTISQNTQTNRIIQSPSNIETPAFIPDIQKEKELQKLNKDVNDLIIDNYNMNITSSISIGNISDIHKNISSSCIGLLDDALNKPSDIMWIDYIQLILKKNQRYVYIGFLLIFIAFCIVLTKSDN